MSEQSCIFVYGTLKRGHCRAHYLTGQHFLGVATTLPEYRLFDCGEYPCLVESSHGGNCIEGEVWSINQACRNRLDIVEAVAEGLYKRAEIQLSEFQLEPATESTVVESYFYLRSVTAFRDCGRCWP